jgi:predicted methyltransferase
VDRPNYEQDVRNRQALPREVLQYLLAHGPIGWNMLYVQFDPYRTVGVEAVLQDLKYWKYIEVDREERVNITELGLELFKEER